MTHDDEPLRRRPAGMSDATVAALGKLSEAFETVEYARGQLYEFHRRSGTADRLLQDAVAELAEAWQPELAEELNQKLVGRNVLPGMWTFQVVEGYDEQYWSVFRDLAEWVRTTLDAPKHLYEAEMKYREQHS